MAAPGQPAPYPGDTNPPPGACHLKRRFTDPLGRDLNGTLTGTPRTRLENDTTVIPAIPFKATVTSGLLAIDLPAGTYSFTGNLTGPGGTVRETFTVTLEAPCSRSD